MEMEKKQLSKLFTGFSGRFGPQARHLMVYHDAYGYMVGEDLFAVSVVISTHGEDLSMKQFAALQDHVANTNIDCVITPASFNHRLLDKLFDGRPYRVTSLDPMAWDGEYLDYVNWMGLSLRKLKECASH